MSCVFKIVRKILFEGLANLHSYYHLNKDDTFNSCQVFFKKGAINHSPLVLQKGNIFEV